VRLQAALLKREISDQLRSVSDEETHRWAVAGTVTSAGGASLKKPAQRKITGDSFTPHPERDRSDRHKHRGVTAWILQWVEPEIADAPLALALPEVSGGVVSILSPRFSDSEVLKTARAIYIAQRRPPQESSPSSSGARTQADAGERAARSEVRPNLPSASGDQLRRRRLDRPFRIGPSPCLYARKVTKLRERRVGYSRWEEIPLSPDVRPA